MLNRRSLLVGRAIAGLGPRTLRQPGNVTIRFASTLEANLEPEHIAEEPKKPAERLHGSIYISNVLPVRLGRSDPRPGLASVLREESLLERLELIAHDEEYFGPFQTEEGTGEVGRNGWRVEGWEIAQKDGGIFLHFSCFPPDPEVPSDSTPPPRFNPYKHYLPLLTLASAKHGGFPSWLGDTWAKYFLSSRTSIADEAGSSGDDPEKGIRLGGIAASIYDRAGVKVSKQEQDEIPVTDAYSSSEKRRLIGVVGDGRCWAVKGKQWNEDLDRYPSTRIRIEFDGPDVSQEVLYELFRPYGRLRDIQPPSPVPAGSLRFAVVTFTRFRAATIAINTLHGLSTPTNTRDFTLLRDPSLAEATLQGQQLNVPRTRLRLFYERPLKAHAIRDWISGHPRIVFPVAAFLLGSLSYTFFDPIRAFFVRAKLDHAFDIEQYSAIRWIRSKILPTGFSFRSGNSGSAIDDNVKNDDKMHGGMKDRVEAEKSLDSWLKELPETYITVTAPPGSGKGDLTSRAIAKQNKQVLTIDCAQLAKAKTDKALVDELANQTGYAPVFSWMSSISGLIDLASLGLIGQKAGFATPIDQQLKQILEVVGGALKDVGTNNREEQEDKVKQKAREVEYAKVEAERSEKIRAGGWHDGRLDCIAGNGVMSELGFGIEALGSNDLVPHGSSPGGLAIQTTAGDAPSLAPSKTSREVDSEREYVKSLPVLVLANFTHKAVGKTEIWNVLAEFAAGLIENHICHVIVISDSTSAAKALTKALPTKPLNSINLSDADMENSMVYLGDKIGSQAALSAEETQYVNRLGGRMIDLDLLVYKVRSGFTVTEAVEDIITRNVIELRKQAFGDDTEDAKSLAWTRAQAWKVVSELGKKPEISYANLLQEFPFKGQEAALRALEEHDLIAVSYVEGRPSMVRPGKPVFRWAFERLTADPVFAASSQIDYNAALITKAEADIKAYEAELLQLQEIASHDGSKSTLSSLPFSGKSATGERIDYLLSKMSKTLGKLTKWERENESSLRTLATGHL